MRDVLQDLPPEEQESCGSLPSKPTETQEADGSLHLQSDADIKTSVFNSHSMKTYQLVVQDEIHLDTK